MLPTDDPDHPEEDFTGLSTGPVECLGGFDLTQDDPSHYNDRNTFIIQRREWPGKPYPAGSDMDLDAVPGRSTGPSAAAGAPGAVSADPDEISASSSGVREMHAHMRAFHEHAHKMCFAGGIKNICAEFLASRMENVLSNLSSKDLVCRYCQHKASSLTHLKNHIRSRHLQKTKHYCALCKKYFSEASALKTHNLKHNPEAPKHVCPECQKEYSVKWKLDDHLISHQAGANFTCEYCNSAHYKHKRGLKNHYETCTSHPEYDPDKRFKCKICTKDYPQNKSLKRHYKEKHSEVNQDDL